MINTPYHHLKAGCSCSIARLWCSVQHRCFESGLPGRVVTDAEELVRRLFLWSKAGFLLLGRIDMDLPLPPLLCIESRCRLVICSSLFTSRDSDWKWPCLRTYEQALHNFPFTFSSINPRFLKMDFSQQVQKYHAESGGRHVTQTVQSAVAIWYICGEVCVMLRRLTPRGYRHGAGPW